MRNSGHGSNYGVPKGLRNDSLYNITEVDDSTPSITDSVLPTSVSDCTKWGFKRLRIRTGRLRKSCITSSSSNRAIESEEGRLPTRSVEFSRAKAVVLACLPSPPLKKSRIRDLHGYQLSQYSVINIHTVTFSVIIGNLTGIPSTYIYLSNSQFPEYTPISSPRSETD